MLKLIKNDYPMRSDDFIKGFKDAQERMIGIIVPDRSKDEIEGLLFVLQQITSHFESKLKSIKRKELKVMK